MNNYQRNISINISRQDDTIIAKTLMTDEFHNLSLQVFVDFDSLTIKDIDLNFAKSPVPQCKAMETRLSGLIGSTIGKGITRKVFELTSGSEGCINVRNMLLSSLPLVINLKAGSGIEDREMLKAAIAKDLEGTCIGHKKQ